MTVWSAFHAPPRINAARVAACFLLLGTSDLGAEPRPQLETRYLLFQVFTAAATPDQAMGATATLKEVPDRTTLETFAGRIKARIGLTGGKRRKLGFVLGPISLDHTDRQVSRLVADSFAIARSLDMAVALHIDDSMYWTRYPGLQQGNEHLEWIDWVGTTNTGRRIDWGPDPARIGPQLCFNSMPVMKAVKERAALIGREVAREYRLLKQGGHEHLFAGVIAGWETMLGKDFASGRATGYCALTNNGYSRSRPPADLDRARAAIVKDFMELWASSLHREGIPRHLIYNHIAFTAQGLSGNKSDHPPGDTAFSDQYGPGFSTYPAPGALSEVLALLKQHRATRWASVEGTNVVPNGMPGERTMETYLGRMFNNGAILVNIFSWGVGPPDSKRNPFRVPTEGPDAIAGYRLFLSGATLREEPSQPFSLSAFQQKLQEIQSRLPQWVQRTQRQHDAQTIMRRLEGHINSGDLASADQVADEALSLLAR
jgi:hypothetical protein